MAPTASNMSQPMLKSFSSASTLSKVCRTHAWPSAASLAADQGTSAPGTLKKSCHPPAQGSSSCHCMPATGTH